MFNQRLKKAMETLDLKPIQVSKMTGIGRSSISQYLSGKNEPTEKRKKAIAEALGLPEDYFNSEDEITIKPFSGAVPRLSVDDAARLMGVGTKFITNGLRDGVFPWGYAVKGRGDKHIYFINAKRFAEVEGVKI